jgi:replication factor A1
MDGPPEGAAGTDTATATATGTDAGGSDAATGGLDAFTDGPSSRSGSGSSTGSTAATADDGAAGAATATTASGSGAADGESDDGPVEFTGTVVQAGSPVVLDDGQETRSVETSEQLTLGQEVTVRGPVRDGRIQAEEIR